MSNKNIKTETLSQGVKFNKQKSKLKCNKSNYINNEESQIPNKLSKFSSSLSYLEGFDCKKDVGNEVKNSQQLLKDTLMCPVELAQLQELKNQFQALLQSYESLSNSLIDQTTSYVSNTDTSKMYNVYVNNLVNNPSSKFVGCYLNNNTSSPAYTSLNLSLFDYGNIYNINTCEQSAIQRGYKYFGLQNYGNEYNQAASCVMTNDLSSAQSLGIAGTDAMCAKGSDGYLYGSLPITDKNGNPTVPNAIYKVPDAKYVGTYGDNPNRAMNLVNGGSQTFTYETCKQQAISSGASLFALQDFNSGSQTAQCALSNDFSQATEYGTTNNYTTGNDGYIYGGGWANSIYQINNNASYNGCYKDNTNTPAMTQATTNTSGTSNVFVACGAIDGPWGRLTSFPDQSAVWIWYTANSSQNAPVNQGNPVSLMYEYNNISPNPMTATIFSIIDDIGELYVNSTYIGTYGDNWGGGPAGNPAIYSITLKPGYNNITVAAVNVGGPAGLLLTCLNSSNQVLFNSNSAWTFTSSTTNMSANSFTYNTCLQTALNNKSKYFALKGTEGNATCYLSNNLQEATQYGKALPCEKGPDGGLYGNIGINALYSVNNGGNSADLGKVGYINESGELSEYPSTMINKGTTYSTINQNSNNPFHDFPNAPFTNSSVEECKNICNGSNDCVGFVFDGNVNNCWPKTQIPISNYYPYGNVTTYLRDPSVNNSSSCSKNVKPIDSVEWESYKKSGNQMTPNTLCGLAKNVQPSQEQLNTMRGNLAILADQIINITNKFKNQNNSLNVQSYVDTNLLNDSLTQYILTSEKFAEFKKYGNPNINGILNDTQIKVKQNSYVYIFWAILAIIFLLLAVFIYKASK